MNITSVKPLIFSMLIGAALTYAVTTVSRDDTVQREQLAALENRILDLESLLTQKEKELDSTRAFVFGNFERQVPGNNQHSGKVVSEVTTPQAIFAEHESTAAEVVGGDQKVKDLSTSSDRDPRSFSDKVNDLLAINPSKENIAVASKSVFDMAENRESLPDYALESLYQQQANPDLKRVIAQVMSARGDNSLIEKQINEAQAGLKNTNPATRQKALIELAKTHHASAANAIAPLLQDSDTGVKLDALLALKATGNQSHIQSIEALVNHPDPSVSWLANDVINSLQNLSDKARTRIASSDIIAELPLMDAP